MHNTAYSKSSADSIQPRKARFVPMC